MYGLRPRARRRKDLHWRSAAAPNWVSSLALLTTTPGLPGVMAGVAGLAMSADSLGFLSKEGLYPFAGGDSEGSSATPASPASTRCR